jgi:hypothetical protein
MTVLTANNGLFLSAPLKSRFKIPSKQDCIAWAANALSMYKLAFLTMCLVLYSEVFLKASP